MSHTSEEPRVKFHVHLSQVFTLLNIEVKFIFPTGSTTTNPIPFETKDLLNGLMWFHLLHHGFLVFHVEVSKVMGVTPSHHPLFRWGFPWNKPSSYWSTTMTMETSMWTGKGSSALGRSPRSPLRGHPDLLQLPGLRDARWRWWWWDSGAGSRPTSPEIWRAWGWTALGFFEDLATIVALEWFISWSKFYPWFIPSWQCQHDSD